MLPFFVCNVGALLYDFHRINATQARQASGLYRTRENFGIYNPDSPNVIKPISFRTYHSF